MLRQFIVYGSFGAICVEDDSEIGAIEAVLLSFDYPEYGRVSKVIEVYTY